MPLHSDTDWVRVKTAVHSEGSMSEIMESITSLLKLHLVCDPQTLYFHEGISEYDVGLGNILPL